MLKIPFDPIQVSDDLLKKMMIEQALGRFLHHGQAHERLNQVVGPGNLRRVGFVAGIKIGLEVTSCQSPPSQTVLMAKFAYSWYFDNYPRGCLPSK